MPSTKFLQHSSQVMIFDVCCRGIQLIRCPGGAVVDRFGALSTCCAHAGGNRMERAPCLISRLIHLPAGGPAELLDRFFGLFAKLRHRFRYCLQSSQDVPPKAAMDSPCMLCQN
jgi:hypothetical protein